MELGHKAALDLAGDGARDALARFGLSAVRIWLFHDESTVLAGSAAVQDGRVAERVTADTARDAAASGATLDGTFMGLPLRANDTNVGYVECYGETRISFADAAGIEAWGADLADAIASASVTEELESPRRGHLLIADDDAAIRKLLETLLTRNGFSVTAVENGMLACERARTLRPDLILLDWMMPILDGCSAAARLKSDPQTRHIPVVMLTSQARTEDKVAALEAGAQDYITKPFDSRELVARIEQQLRWRRLLADDDPVADDVPNDPAPAAKPSIDVRDDGAPPPPPGGDYWTAAVAAQQVGKLRHALSYYVQEAENCDRAKMFARAAIAFRSASVVAGQLQNLDLSNKLLRLSGKMYLSWAENAEDGKAMQEAYVNAARCFLSAGNLKLARKSVEIAESMHSVLGDDRPSGLH